MKNESEEILRYLGELNLSVRASFFSFLRVVDQYVNTLTSLWKNNAEALRRLSWDYKI